MPHTVARSLILLALSVVTSSAPSSALAIEVAAEDVQAIEKAQAAYDAGRFAEAVTLLAPLRTKYPDQADIPRLLTHAYFALGDFARARESALAAIAGGRLSADVVGRIAQIDHRDNDEVAALSAVRLLTILDRDDRRWRMAYAAMLATSGSFDESAAVYRALLAAQPADADVAFRLGNVLVEQQRTTEAAAVLETAWRLGADDDRLPVKLAAVWQSLGDDRQAVAWLERAAAATKADPAVELRIAQLHLKIGDLDRAAETARRLTASDAKPVAAAAHRVLAHVAVARGKIDDAVAEWRKAASRGDADVGMLAALGVHCFNAGDFASAAKYLRRVVDAEAAGSESDGHESEEAERNLRFLVISLIRSDDLDAARGYLRQYLERHGLSDEAKTLVRSLARRGDGGRSAPDDGNAASARRSSAASPLSSSR